MVCILDIKGRGPISANIWRMGRKRDRESRISIRRICISEKFNHKGEKGTTSCKLKKKKREGGLLVKRRAL